MTIWFCIKKLRFIQLCVGRNLRNKVCRLEFTSHLYLFVNWNKDVLIVKTITWCPSGTEVANMALKSFGC